MEVNQKKLATPNTLLSAGLWLSATTILAMVSHPKAVKSALESLKLILDTNEFADLKKEVEQLITKIESLPPDELLDDPNCTCVLGWAALWKKTITNRIKTYQLSILETPLNPESLSKEPEE